MPYISLLDFKIRNNITISTLDTQLTFLLESFSRIIDKETKGMFSVTAKTAADEIRYYGQPGGVNFIKINAWQNDVNLLVKKGCFGSENLETLIKGTDYYLKFPENHLTNPIVSLKFPNMVFFSRDFVQIEGNFGFSVSIPSDLEMLLDQAVLAAMNYRLKTQNQLTTSGGYDIKSESSGNLKIVFSENPEMSKYGSALNSGNLMSVPEIAGIIQEYKALLTTNFLIT